MGFGIQPHLAKLIFPLNKLIQRYGPPRRQLQTLIYHRIGEREEIWPESHSLAECSLEQFEEQMQWLSTYCTPVSIDQVRRIIIEGEPCPPSAVLVTFDDGYREDLFRIVPCLKRTGIRPIVFLPTDYIGSRKRFWWDRISVAVQTSPKQRLTLSGVNGIDLPLKTSIDRQQAIDYLKEQASSLPPAEFDVFISRVESKLEVVDGTESTWPIVLSWEEIQELGAHYDFGAHTMSHAQLSKLSAEAILFELNGSRKIIEEKLGRPCQTLAIPFGGKRDYTRKVIEVASEVGVEMVFSFEESNRAPLRVEKTVLLDRFALNPRAGVASLAAKIIWPNIFILHWQDRIRHGLIKCLEK